MLHDTVTITRVHDTSGRQNDTKVYHSCAPYEQCALCTVHWALVIEVESDPLLQSKLAQWYIQRQRQGNIHNSFPHM